MSILDNKVELTGFAGGDAELKEVGNNKKFARVSIAVHDDYTNGTGVEIKNTQWFTLAFWGVKAEEAAKMIKKGTRFSVRGRLSTQNYEAKDGTKRYTTEVVVSELIVLKSLSEAGKEAED